jgi:hypothetical protein
MKALLVVASLAVGCGLAQPAMAQINPFKGTKAAPLSKGDLGAMNDASVHLLNRQHLAKGAVEPWHTDNSKGTVTAGNTLTHKGLGCRVLNYSYSVVSGPRSDRAGHLTWCKSKDGWKTI